MVVGHGYSPFSGINIIKSHALFFDPAVISFRFIFLLPLPRALETANGVALPKPETGEDL